MNAEVFRKKPVEIEAMQWLGAPTPLIVPSATKVIDWVLANGGIARFVGRGENHALRYQSELYQHGVLRLRATSAAAPAFIAVDTLDATARLDPGDWMVRGVQGEFYPCRSDVFEKTYDWIPSTPEVAL